MRRLNIRPLAMQDISDFLHVPPILRRQQAVIAAPLPIRKDQTRSVVADELRQRLRRQVGIALAQALDVSLVA